MRRVSAKGLFDENDKEIKEVIERIIEESPLATDAIYEAWPGMSISIVLPTEDMWETAAFEAGDGADREFRFQRLVLAKCISRLGDEMEFDIGQASDDAMKLMILGKLPEMMIRQMWSGLTAVRTEMSILLLKAVDVVKKSPASRSGEPDGSSSEPREESASGATGPSDSPTSSKSS